MSEKISQVLRVQKPRKISIPLITPTRAFPERWPAVLVLRGVNTRLVFHCTHSASGMFGSQGTAQDSNSFLASFVALNVFDIYFIHLFIIFTWGGRGMGRLSMYILLYEFARNT